MSISNRSLPSSAAAAALSLAISSSALAVDLVGLDPATSELHRVDTDANSATLLGTVLGGPMFGFAAVDRASDGELYAVAPGFFSGYGVYVIDESSMIASLVANVASDMTGDVGIAIDASATKAWVAGFVGLSLNVKFHEVDLATGAVTPRGILAGNLSGLAFDAAGDLYSTAQGATGPELIRIDRVDAAHSTSVGTMTGVDDSYGLDLASDVTSGGVHALSRNSDVVYAVDTATATATAISAQISGASAIRSIADVAAKCAPAEVYGAGCPGTGTHVPALTWTGCATPGSLVMVDVTGALGGSHALILLGAGTANLSIGGGCSLLLSGISPTGLSVPLGGSSPGAGRVSLSAMLPTTVSSGSFAMQAFVADAAAVTGFSATNGVLVTVR
ncbi:MAG: hypothetical protein ACF8XB_18825 [Planctomycetota bacterium JB042]